MNQESIRERMRVRGEKRFQTLISEAGGMYSTDEVATLLSRPALEIVCMARNRQLIGIERENSWQFPIGQFHDGKLIQGVHEVLAAFNEDVDALSITLFFLSNYERTGRSALSLLKDGLCLPVMIESAGSLYEHGAR